MTIYGAKTFNMDIEVTTNDEIYDSFIKAEDGEHTEDMCKVYDFIREKLVPYVPYKGIKKWGWRIDYKSENKIFVTVTFYMKDEKYLGTVH